MTNLCLRLWRSSLGKKYIMSVSGLVLVAYVVGHLIGNLQIFLPPHAINRYGHFLQSNVELLWVVRLILLTLVALHIVSSIWLTIENRQARPVTYATPVPSYGSSTASRTMMISGLILGAFVLYHLLHFTVRLESINGTPVPFHRLQEAETGYPDIYAMMVAGFGVWYVSLFYLVGVGLLCLHLSHGIGAMFQSLGLKNPLYQPLIQRASPIIALVLFLGYASIPTAVLLGHGRDYLKQSLEHSASRVAADPAGKEVAK